MKTLVMLNYNDDLRLRSVKDEADAEYEVLRRNEKEGFRTTRAWIVDEASGLPVDAWFEKEERVMKEYARKEYEAKEKAEFERLKNKFEGKKP